MNANDPVRGRRGLGQVSSGSTYQSHRAGQRSTMTPDEEKELRALVDQACELRGTPYLVDAAEWIVRWHERRHLRALERRMDEKAKFTRLLRETQP